MIIVIGFVWEGEETLIDTVDGFTVEFETPVRETAVLIVLNRVFDDDAPIANAIFTPMCDRHKSPIIITF